MGRVARIYVYHSGAGIGVTDLGAILPVVVDGREIGATRMDTFVFADVAPGRRVLQTNTQTGHAMLAMDVDAGAVYFVRQRLEPNGLAVGVGLKLVDDKTGRAAVQERVLAQTADTVTTTR
ncbi:MAG: DUF2846 domain-containing protein [Tepidisphaeraceae bacterium]